jgi:NitT/TauT family transport system substrate-binding protein
MLRFQRHGRIQEWVAEELGFFREAGLNYEIAWHRSHGNAAAHPAAVPIPEHPTGQPSAYREFLQGSAITNIASTSHWAVAAAVSAGHGQLWPHAYGIMPAGLYVRPGVTIRQPQDLAELDIVVGRHSGSHFSAIHALHELIPPERIKLKFVAGRTGRLKALLENEAPAGNIYGLEAYILEQHGFQKILDTSFMVSYMIVGAPDSTDVVRYFDALRRAQIAVDENPKRYRHYLLKEFPDEVCRLVHIDRCGIGERVEFGAYSKSMSLRARDWVISQGILSHDSGGPHEPNLR